MILKMLKAMIILALIQGMAEDSHAFSLLDRFVGKRGEVGGKLTESSVRELLLKEARAGEFLNPEIGKIFQSPSCVVPSILSGGGKQTLQLALVRTSRDCRYGQSTEFSDTFILKETGKRVEIDNLRQIYNSPLRRLDLENKYRNPSFPAIAFPDLIFSTGDAKSAQFFILMPAAPGKSLFAYQSEVADIYAKGTFSRLLGGKNTADVHLSRAAYAVGLALGNLHKSFMDPGNKILTTTYVHGDLHQNNVFIDVPSQFPYNQAPLVTLIDIESFAKSLDRKVSPAVDLVVLYGFSVAHVKSEYRIPPSIPMETWHQLFFKPLIRGYLDAWKPQRPNDPDYRRQVLDELREIILSPLNVRQIIVSRVLALNPALYLRYTNQYALPIFKELEAEFPVKSGDLKARQARQSAR